MVAAVPEEAGAAPHGDLWFFEPERQSAETKRALLEAYHAKCVSLGFREPGAGDYRAFYEAGNPGDWTEAHGGRRSQPEGVGERDRLRRGRWE